MRVIKLSHGKGNGIDKACLMTASNMLIGKGDEGDDNSCVCPIIRSFIIPTNDKMPEDLLGKIYSPLIWEILGTKTDDKDVIQKRAYLFVDAAVREFAPLALEQAGLNEHSNNLRNLPKIVDTNTAKLAYTAAAAAYAAANAAYVAANAANAANAAAYAAAVAVSYAAAAAVAAANAANAANAAAYAANAAAYAANAAWERCASLIIEACKIGDKRPVEPCLTENQLCEMLG